MKKTSFYTLLMATALLGMGSRAFAVADPSVNGAAISPTPITVATGISGSFNVTNNGTATSSPSVKITASLGQIRPAADFDIAAHISGPGAALFTWSYNILTNSFTGTLNQNWAPFTGGQVIISNLVSTGISLPGTEANGLNVNVNAPGTFNSSLTNDNTFVFTSSSVALPVQFASFSSMLSGCVPVLSWTTSMEQHVASMSVQRSTDGSAFTTVGTVMPKGNNSSYTYRDQDAPKDKLTYRLMSIDVDGSRQYSDIETLNNSDCQGGIDVLIVYPNPVQNGSDVHVKLTATSAQAKAKLLITDISGRVLTSQAVTVAAGANHYLVPTRTLATGTYLLKLESDAGDFALPAVKLTWTR